MDLQVVTRPVYKQKGLVSKLYGINSFSKLFFGDSDLQKQRFVMLNSLVVTNLYVNSLCKNVTMY